MGGTESLGKGVKGGQNGVGCRRGGAKRVEVQRVRKRAKKRGKKEWGVQR